MGFVKAFTGALGGSLADQWKDFYMVPEGLSATAAIFAAEAKGTNHGRGANTKGNDNIVTSGSKIIVPEGTALITMEDGAITGIVAEPGGFIYIPIGKKEMRISTTEMAGPVPLDEPAFIKNNRTMLPLRAIAEMFDMDVAWDEAARAVRISSPDHYLKPYVNVENAAAEVMDRLKKMSLLDAGYYATDVLPETANYNNLGEEGFRITLRKDNPVDKNLIDHVRHFFINKTGTAILEYDPVTDGYKEVLGVN